MPLENKEFWVYVETDEKGFARQVGAELLGMAQRMVSFSNFTVVAVIVGSQIQRAVAESVSFGADEVLFVDRSDLFRYRTESYVDVLYQLVTSRNPETFIFGSTPEGRDIAPRLACRLSTGLVADCTGVDLRKDNSLIAWTRPALSNHLMATILCPYARPQMGTVRPGVFARNPQNWNRKAKVIDMTSLCSIAPLRTWILHTCEEAEGKDINLAQSDIIVAGGLGLQSQKGFHLVWSLAEVLGGMVGATRKVVEAGWIGRAHQIGQTGKMVSPRLYIACGLSGSLQHMVGMQTARCIVAINTDPDAPIFDIADYRIVGSALDIIPLLIQEIQQNKNKKKGKE